MRRRQDRRSAVLIIALLVMTACSASAPLTPEGRSRMKSDSESLMKWPDLIERPRPEPDHELTYGTAPLQRVDLWLPSGDGPHRTVLMVHGGCWQSDIADRRLMNWIADDLRGRGLAVWNIDYRGVDREGGGYPGTFLDAAAAADLLATQAERFRLDLSRLVAVGHSAGGHLALWLAARPRLPARSPLRTGGPPIGIRRVVSLGGLPDLEAAARPPGSGCGTEVIARLTGGRFDDTSVPRLAPLGIDQILVNGRDDRIIPLPMTEDYVAVMRRGGDRVDLRVLPRTGHVELVAPESAAWAAAVEAILEPLE